MARFIFPQLKPLFAFKITLIPSFAGVYEIGYIFLMIMIKAEMVDAGVGACLPKVDKLPRILPAL